MSSDSLEHAIELIKKGKPIEARKLLKPLIAADRHNLTAWFWFIKTCSTHQQRLNILEICLEYNPDSEQIKQALEAYRKYNPDGEQVKQALDKLQILPIQELLAQSSDKDSHRGYKFVINDPLLVGFGIACIHFLITLFWEQIIPFIPYSVYSLGDFIALILRCILLAPSYILFMLGFILPIIMEFLWHIDLELLYIPASSLFYGIVGGFFVSREKYLRLISIILIGLFILGGCFLAFSLVIFYRD